MFYLFKSSYLHLTGDPMVPFHVRSPRRVTRGAADCLTAENSLPGPG
jgi:hypothetical protein